jgi:hypothetical protein
MPIRPICFVVMPFGTKETGATQPNPLRIDFDALWRDAISPALESLGYRAVRADQDTGAVIVKEMLERLFFSHLVVADISIANANAYYEIGVRHAAREDNCVLIAADWAMPVFDLQQIRRIPYSLPEERISDDTALRIRNTLTNAIPEACAGRSPVHTLISGYPSIPADNRRAQELADQLDEFETLRGQLLAIRNMPAQDRLAVADVFLSNLMPADIRLDAAAIEIFHFIRDVCGDWSRTIAFIDALPAGIRNTPYLREQRALAQSYQGSHTDAVAALEALIRLYGDSCERSGLIGGRYKKLYNASIQAGKPDRRMLDRAIKAYERGMFLNLNEYYCSCNLPQLYRERDDDGDNEQANAVAAVARLACERARQRGNADEWLKPTLLGLAFSERNPALARQLTLEVEREGSDAWKIGSTLADLRRHVSQMKNPAIEADFSALIDRLATA